mgnify:CR=1 FL=1|jgi:hypothetical protein
MIIVPLIDELIPELEIFCDKAKELGYNNNSSLEAMKYDWCKKQGEYFCAIVDNDIVAVAGCHPLPEINDKAWRVMFRGAQLPGYNKSFGLNKYHMSAITWREILPAQIQFCDTDELYITTNVEYDASGKMNKIHRLFKSLHKLGMVNYHGRVFLYQTEQSVWKLNINEYTKRRNMIGDKYVV